MAGHRWKQCLGMLALLACSLYSWLVHIVISATRVGSLTTFLALLPLLAMGGWILVRSRRGYDVMLAAAGLALVAYLVNRYGRGGLATGYGLSHALIYVSLLLLFARTLVGGQEPLITCVARRVHGDLSPGMEAHTRRLTLVWCVFFAGQLIVSAALLRFASLQTWSLFVNVLNFPLLVVMFLAEYLYRSLYFPEYSRVSVADMIKAFAQESSPG